MKQVSDHFNDEQERKETAEVLKDLPSSHPARVALEVGTGPVALSRLIDCADVAARLKRVYLEGYNRVLVRKGGKGFITG